jgi:hypothetical protein
MIEKEWWEPGLVKGLQVEDEIDEEKLCPGLKSWTRRICGLSIPG